MLGGERRQRVFTSKWLLNLANSQLDSCQAMPAWLLNFQECPPDAHVHLSYWSAFEGWTSICQDFWRNFNGMHHNLEQNIWNLINRIFRLRFATKMWHLVIHMMFTDFFSGVWGSAGASSWGENAINLEKFNKTDLDFFRLSHPTQTLLMWTQSSLKWSSLWRM